jgi:acyl-CoA dehydrogenase
MAKNRGRETVAGVFRFDPLTLPPECESLRQDVRAFLVEEKAAGRWRAGGDFSQGHSPEFSRRLGARGWRSCRASPAANATSVSA